MLLGVNLVLNLNLNIIKWLRYYTHNNVSYPTFIFFIDGIPFEWDGVNRRIDHMINWMKKIIEA